jgi:hypothetical protein
MYFGTPFSSADFHSTLYGSVFRLDGQYGLQVRPILDPGKVSDNGEWGGLQHASWLISKRLLVNEKTVLTIASVFRSTIPLTAAQLPRPFAEIHQRSDVAGSVHHLRLEPE